MSALGATWRLYAESARDAVRSLGRSALAVVALFLATPVLFVAGVLTAPMGFAGGLVMGLVHAAVVSAYLSLVEIGVTGLRRVSAADLVQGFGRYLWDVIGVLFVFWIASLLLMASPVLQGVAVLAATLVFNPIPEMIYQEREARSLALLGGAARFMQENWPEWLGAHAAFAALLALWGAVVSGGVPDAALGLSLVQLFGPWFGFISAGTLSLDRASLGAAGVIQAVVLLVLVHAIMLFRGQLYRRLRGSSRRGRAWRARMR